MSIFVRIILSSTNGRLLLAEFQDGHANGLGILYDKNMKVLSKGIWKDGSVHSELKPNDEGKLKTIEQAAKQYNDRSFEENYKVSVVPITNIVAEEGSKAPILQPSKPGKDSPKKDKDSPKKVKDSPRKEIDSARKEDEPETNKEKPKTKASKSKSQAKASEKDEEKTVKIGKATSRSKEPKKVIKKKDLDDDDDD